jgi:hypothetical protein
MGKKLGLGASFGGGEDPQHPTRRNIDATTKWKYPGVELQEEMLEVGGALVH